jgi:hypothetical protein
MGLLLSREQVARLPNGGGVSSLALEGPTLTRERSGAYMRGSIALRTIATHPRVIALVTATVAGCLALLINFVGGRKHLFESSS